MRNPLRSGSCVLFLAALGLAPAHAESICVAEFPLTGIGGSGSAFGRSVAVDGARAVVCGELEAYAFAWTAGGWVQEAVLTIPGAEPGFGASVALAGDRILVGLPLQDGPQVDCGRALVFVRDANGAWTLEDELQPQNPVANDRFGTAVALQADRALVGSPRDDSAGLDAGSVFVFQRAGAVWGQTAEILSSAPGSRFGTSVALSGNTALVGSALFFGGVTAHVVSGVTWSAQAALVPALVLPSQVALEGERAVVGGLFESVVLERSGTSWTETARLPVTGATVALDGGILVLGGSSCPTLPAARVFVLDTGVWVESAALQIEGASMPVALSERRVLVGTRGGIACAGGVASSFELTLAPAPSVAFRNAGTNPASYTAVSASLGGTLELSIDLTTTGHTMGLVVGFDSPFQLTLPGGQTLLCLDQLASGGELINTGFRPGPIAHHSLAVPNLPFLAGFRISTQALHAFGVLPFALSNAQDLRIGACP